jgi:Mn2+/Fe2+ NRAMP family transporter
MAVTRKWSNRLKALGPGLLWAGAAVGVSHLVQSTRAGASYGFALVWVVILANLLKYPAFEFGPRYAAATGESLLEGYLRVGKWAMAIFLVLTLGTMFTIQAAVTVVTAGLAAKLFGLAWSPVIWSAIMVSICAIILMIGRYPLLDKVIKGIIILLTLSTLFAVFAALSHGRAITPEFVAPQVWTVAGISFMVALAGWMPSAIDISVWHSLWTLERGKDSGHKPSVSESLFDFNLGYFGTALLAVSFLTLGAMVMYGSGESFSSAGAVFGGQLINLYTAALGEWSRPIIGIAAFTTMFSTTLTVTDAFPRVLRRTSELLFKEHFQDRNTNWLYWAWMIFVLGISLVVTGFFLNGMTILVDLATTLSFLTAPVLAYINHRAVTGDWVPAEAQPKPWLRALSWVAIVFLASFGIFFLIWRFVV